MKPNEVKLTPNAARVIRLLHTSGGTMRTWQICTRLDLTVEEVEAAMNELLSHGFVGRTGSQGQA